MVFTTKECGYISLLCTGESSIIIVEQKLGELMV
jgi:hypothetical protein